MKKAFIFDFDGVIINSEPLWEVAKTELYQRIFGREIFLKMGLTVGMSVDAIYDRAVQCGAIVDKKFFVEEFFAKAPEIYANAPLTPGTESIAKTLIGLGYKIGIVSASPIEWLEIALKRIDLKDSVSFILSLYDREDIPHKPAPDGYLKAMDALGSSPQTTIILEDSKTGIQSAKACGAFTIGFRQNLLAGQSQDGADAYANDFEDVVRLVGEKVF